MSYKQEKKNGHNTTVELAIKNAKQSKKLKMLEL